MADLLCYLYEHRPDGRFVKVALQYFKGEALFIYKYLKDKVRENHGGT